MVRRNEVVVLGGVSAGNHDFLYRGIIERLQKNFIEVMIQWKYTILIYYMLLS